MEKPTTGVFAQIREKAEDEATDTFVPACIEIHIEILLVRRHTSDKTLLSGRSNAQYALNTSADRALYIH